MELAPLCVPVEIRRADAPGRRWFRLALGIGSDRLRLRSALPLELCGPPLAARLHLPPPTERLDALLDSPGSGWDGGISFSAVAGEVLIDQGTERERPEARLLLFSHVGPAERARIADYITLRLLSDE